MPGPLSASLGHTLGQARRRATGAAHRTARRVATSRVGQRIRRPSVSVIVPFYNVEKYIADCLDSIRAQSTSDFEVVLVDDGSPDGSRAIAQRYVETDSRFRMVTRPNGGLGAARNTGVRAARGRWLTFLDSDDLLPPNALAALVQSARRTGSDIVVGSVERFDSMRYWTPSWVNEVHTHRLEGVRLVDYLPLMRNLYTWNKLYRRDFWNRHRMLFREGVAYEDQPIVTQLLMAADTIDVIPDVVYSYRARDDRSSISQQTSTVKDLLDRVAAWRASQEALRDAPEVVRLGWLQTLFDAHFAWYLMSAGTVDDEFWKTIRSVVVDLTAEAPQEIWDAAPPGKRVLIELTRQDRREDVQELVRRDAVRRSRGFASRPTDGGIVLELPFFGDPALPEELFLIRPEQLRVMHAIERVDWTPEGLRISGWAYLRKLDLGDRSSHVDVVVVDTESGAEEVHPAADDVGAESPMPLPDDWCDYRRGTFAATVPISAFTDGSRGKRLELQVTAAGFTVRTLASVLVRAGAAGAPEAAWLPDGTRLVLDWKYRDVVVVRRHPPGLRLGSVSVTGATVRGVVTGPGQERVRDVEVVRGHTVHGAPVRRTPEGAAFEVTLPAPGRQAVGRPAEWTLRALLDQRTKRPLELPGAEPEASGQSLVVGRDWFGLAVVSQWRCGAVADAMEITESGALRVSGRVLVTGAPPEEIRLTTSTGKATSTGPVGKVVDGRFVAELDLRHDHYRFGRLPLPLGEHAIRVLVPGPGPDAAATDVPLLLSAALNRDLPLRVGTAAHQGQVRRGPDGGAQLALVRPLGDDVDRSTQAGLHRQAATRRETATRRALLVRSYFGEKCTDNGVAIQAELRRRGSDLPVFWAVQDHSIPVPDGGVPVVVNSREWFDLLQSATYYLDNMYQPTYHLKPEGQVLVQTFHGYPFKQMGLPHWQHQQFSRAKIESYFQRSAEWDFLVSPARYATPLLTRDFCYDGPVLEIGYPRNDVLFTDPDGVLRETVRASLGILPHQTAVLYAPTFRDYLARDDNQAPIADFFDFDAVTSALGEDAVVLMRGHAFHARTRQRVGSRGRVLDVTDYPEVSDLYLAADVGVVDYSSLRFDFGITGKPMVFLVPDLERYVETRGWLFDFEPTAPGPLVRTTEELVAALCDLPGIQERYAAAYDTFRKTYLDLEDGHAAARFVDAVMGPRGDA